MAKHDATSKARKVRRIQTAGNGVRNGHAEAVRRVLERERKRAAGDRTSSMTSIPRSSGG